MAHLRKVLSSTVFHSSESLQRLLGYLVEHSAKNAPHPVKEFQIATDVFGRGPHFDPADRFQRARKRGAAALETDRVLRHRRQGRRAAHRNTEGFVYYGVPTPGGSTPADRARGRRCRPPRWIRRGGPPGFGNSPVRGNAGGRIRPWRRADRLVWAAARGPRRAASPPPYLQRFWDQFVEAPRDRPSWCSAMPVSSAMSKRGCAITTLPSTAPRISAPCIPAWAI